MSHTQEIRYHLCNTYLCTFYDVKEKFLFSAIKSLLVMATLSCIGQPRNFLDMTAKFRICHILGWFMCPNWGESAKIFRLLGNWHKDEQNLNPSLWGEPVCGSIHGLAISTTHTVTSAGGSSRPSSPPLVSPVSTYSPPTTRMCTWSLPDQDSVYVHQFAIS